VKPKAPFTGPATINRDSSKNAPSGAVSTTMVAVPATPPALAVTVVVPGPAPVTTPEVDTVATAPFAVAQVAVKPVQLVWVMAALSEVVSVTNKVSRLGLTTTAVTTQGTAVTVIDAVPLTPLTAAVIVADPTVTPVTTPVDETVATMELLVDQVAVRPVQFSCEMVAVKGVVDPATTDPLVGLTATAVTVQRGGSVGVELLQAINPAAVMATARAARTLIEFPLDDDSGGPSGKDWTATLVGQPFAHST
jgi:hypothetical protein